MKYQGHAGAILDDVLGRIEICVMEGGTITYVDDAEVPTEDRPAGLLRESPK